MDPDRRVAEIAARITFSPPVFIQSTMFRCSRLIRVLYEENTRTLHTSYMNQNWKAVLPVEAIWAIALVSNDVPITSELQLRHVEYLEVHSGNHRTCARLSNRMPILTQFVVLHPSMYEPIRVRLSTRLETVQARPSPADIWDEMMLMNRIDAEVARELNRDLKGYYKKRVPESLGTWASVQKYYFGVKYSEKEARMRVGRNDSLFATKRTAGIKMARALHWSGCFDYVKQKQQEHGWKWTRSVIEKLDIDSVHTIKECVSLADKFSIWGNPSFSFSPEYIQKFAAQMKDHEPTQGGNKMHTREEKPLIRKSSVNVHRQKSKEGPRKKIKLSAYDSSRNKKQAVPRDGDAETSTHKKIVTSSPAHSSTANIGHTSKAQLDSSCVLVLAPFVRSTTAIRKVSEPSRNEKQKQSRSKVKREDISEHISPDNPANNEADKDRGQASGHIVPWRSRKVERSSSTRNTSGYSVEQRRTESSEEKETQKTDGQRDGPEHPEKRSDKENKKRKTDIQESTSGSTFSKKQVEEIRKPTSDRIRNQAQSSGAKSSMNTNHLRTTDVSQKDFTDGPLCIRSGDMISYLNTFGAEKAVGTEEEEWIWRRTGRASLNALIFVCNYGLTWQKSSVKKIVVLDDFHTNTLPSRIDQIINISEVYYPLKTARVRPEAHNIELLEEALAFEFIVVPLYIPENTTSCTYSSKYGLVANHFVAVILSMSKFRKDVLKKGRKAWESTRQWGIIDVFVLDSRSNDSVHRMKTLETWHKLAYAIVCRLLLNTIDLPLRSNRFEEVITNVVRLPIEQSLVTSSRDDSTCGWDVVRCIESLVRNERNLRNLKLLSAGKLKEE